MHTKLEATLCWGESILSSVLVDPKHPVRVGGSKAELFLPESVVAPFVLAEAKGQNWQVHPPNGTPKSLSLDETAQISIDRFSIFLRPVAPPDPVPRRAWDWTFPRWALASASFHGLLLAIFLMAPPEAGAITTNPSERMNRYVDWVRVPTETLPSTSPAPGQSKNAEASQATINPANQAPAPTPTRGSRRRRGPRRSVPMRREDVANLLSLKAIAYFEQNMPATGLWDVETSLDGWDPTARLNLPSEFRTRTGRGTCPPGAQCDAGLILAGPLGDVLQPTSEPGALSTMLRRRPLPSGTRRRPCEHGGCVTVPASAELLPQGGLAAGEVRRVIRRNLSQVRFCYEHALQGKPDLAGRIKVGFIIQPSGAVQSVRVLEDSLHDSHLQQCLIGRVRTWAFPSSDRITTVNYPFLLQPGS